MENIKDIQKVIYITFLKKFEEVEKKPFVQNKEAIVKLKSLIYYITKDERFFTLDILDKEFSEPSFDKGMLIIGGFGTGKTSFMNALRLTLNNLNFSCFAMKNTNQIVMDYECLEQNQKRDFFNSFTKGTWVFDDLLNEREANNYGKVELFKDILELRCYHKKPTHATCNYDPNFKDDLKMGLLQFNVKYGGRVYDRLFEMFNIIEFKGKSLRR